MSNRVAHFEIHADDVERCVRFYQEIFGWKITKWDGGDVAYWMVETGPREEAGGINGGIVKRMGPRPEAGAPVFGYVCTLIVDDYDAAASKIEAAGGKVALQKFKIADMAWQGYYLDTEGNIFGIHQPLKKEG